MVCRPIPPAPGDHLGPVPCPRRFASSCQLSPPSVDLNSAASSTPAYTTSGLFGAGSKCHTRLNSQGCCVPSYHWCVVSGLPVASLVSYANLLLGFGGQLWASSPGLTPGWNHVLPPSSERCTTCPNQPLVCDA